MVMEKAVVDFKCRPSSALWFQIVYNMGGPLFVWGWFFFLMGTSSVPGDYTKLGAYAQEDSSPYNLPLFVNWRTALSFIGGCAMVPVVGFLDFSHDEDGPWCVKATNPLMRSLFL
jgi:hypothetical protein